MTTGAAITTSSRMTWMDEVRGTAILLLLLWHASAVPTLFGTEMPEVVRSVNAFFLPYRMPTLMLLSGMLLARSLRKPLPVYYAGKIAMVLWPYLIWVTIAKMTFLDAEALPWWHWRAWYATTYLWFLFFIGVYYAVAPFFRRLPPWVPIALGTALALYLPQGSTNQRLGYFAIFFFAGSWLASTPDLINRLARPRASLLLAVPAIAYGTASAIWPDQLEFMAWGAPMSIAGGLALVGAFAHPRRGGLSTSGVQFLGRSSIVFYVSHFPIMAILSQSAVSEAGSLALAAVNLAMALLLGYLLAWGKETAAVSWLFRAPHVLTGAIAAAPDAIRRSARSRRHAGARR
ncbi:acyltransferase family protein [Brachybacterium paraconglomeratum]|uniref:acyltransferase family protein n=1 Tax=Brachybacterium paraconglomeratum TaxID=173362 RepID=UPI0038796138